MWRKEEVEAVVVSVVALPDAVALEALEVVAEEKGL